MDVDASSPSSGEATSEQENEMESHLAKRFNPGTQPEEPEQESEEISSYSVTARWRKRATQYEDLKHMMQQWCQQDTPAITDQQLPAPSAFLFERETMLCPGVACCAICEAVAGLKASCESFVKSKEEYSAAKKQHAEAEKDYAEAKKQHAESENQVMPNGPSSQNDRMLELLTRLVAAEAGRVAAEAGRVAAEASRVADKAKLISTVHCEVKSLLGALRAAGNEATLVTKESRGVRSTISLDKTRFDAKPQSSPSKFDKLCNPSAMEFSKIDFLPSLEMEHMDLLDPFYKHLKRVFGKASMLDGDDEQCRLKIEGTVNVIIGWDGGEHMEPSMTKFYTPGYVGQERDGVQPILYAIMVKMAQVLGLGPHITREQGIPRVENRRGRYIDFVVTSSAEEYLFAILPAMLGVPIEVKPITRKDTTVDKLLLEAQNQVVGHLAKRAMFSFDFGGIVEDCTVFGLELTMGSVTVVVLKLFGVGTADVQVTAERTKRVPLFDKDTRKKLFGEKARDVEASFEIEKEPQGLPEGFCLLARTLMSVHHGLGKSLMIESKGCHPFSMRTHAAESIEVGQYLGSGAFSHVLELRVKGSDDVFIKVPKSDRMKKSLESEANVLKDLCGLCYIPQLYDTDAPIKTLDIKIRCESSALPCLPLRGLIGRPASHQQDWKSDKLFVIFSKVYAALEYANHKGWAHLDVRPSNIITRADPLGDSVEVMLIDWGCAHRTAAKLKGFIGCPPYAHDELFGQTKEWNPRVDHDLASLAYSVASLYHGCIPWSGFSNHRAVPDDVRKRRFEMASTALEPLLQKWDVSQNVMEALLKAIDHKGSKKVKQKKSWKSPQTQRKRSHGSE